MRYVAMLSSGRAWAVGKTVGEQDREVMLAHLHAMRKGYDDGTVLFGGPFRSSEGGIALLEAESRLHARSFMDRDPTVSAGILDYDLFEVRPFFDAISGDAWSQQGSG
ncbi:MAG: YciI family protein [Rhodomicrobium sp.]